MCLFKFQHCARCDSKHSKCVACNAPFAVTPQGHCVCPIGWQAATNQFGETTCLSPGVTQLEPYVANITSQITNLTTIVQTITQARPADVMRGGPLRSVGADGCRRWSARHGVRHVRRKPSTATSAREACISVREYRGAALIEKVHWPVVMPGRHII